MSTFIRVTDCDDEEFLLNPAAIACISRNRRLGGVEITFRNPDQTNMTVKEKLDWLEAEINGTRHFDSEY
jgi:hypothetical protein